MTIMLILHVLCLEWFALAGPISSPESEDLTKLRDPFRQPEVHTEKAAAKTVLERYPAENFKLIGVMSGPDRIRAMVAAPNGKSYFIAEQTRIGLNNGVVQKITPDKIQIREKVTNMNGEKENLDTEIRFSQKDQGVSK